MKIGLLTTTYNDVDTIQRALEPWMTAGPNFIICVIDGLFNNYPIENNSINTSYPRIREWLDKMYEWGNIDHLIYNDKIQEEAEARNNGVKILLNNNIDYLISVGMDEFYTPKEIADLVKFIKLFPLTTSFKVSYRNLTFDNNHYTTGFCPRRVWKVNSSPYKLKGFHWDDDMTYEFNGIDNIIDEQLSTATIPKKLVNPLHDTWRDNQRSRDKIEYQMKHFGHCSFCINPETNKMEFSKEFYSKNNQPIPELYKINE